MKSAYERALEKFGGIREIDDAKKERIAEIDRVYTSKIVGVELSFKDKMDTASTQDEREELRHKMRAEVASLSEKAEKKKEEIRSE